MRAETADLTQFDWMNRPAEAAFADGVLEFATSPGTDFWQGTCTGASDMNGHAFLTRLWDDFSFSVQAEFFYEMLYDQCGLFLFLDGNNWAKCGVEFIDESYSRLGSVVTHDGFSDWACTPFTTDITRMYYRLSRHRRDFRFECSQDGDQYTVMRIFPMRADLSVAKAGIYGCSPSDSSFKARFAEFLVGPSVWKD